MPILQLDIYIDCLFSKSVKAYCFQKFTGFETRCRIDEPDSTHFVTFWVVNILKIQFKKILEATRWKWAKLSLLIRLKIFVRRPFSLI